MSCKTGGQWVRPFGDVSNNVAGVESCAAKCKAAGYKYFGLECPRRTVHCQCAHTLSGSRALSATQCNRKNRGRTHCVGPYTAGPYMLGSHGTGSVYLTGRSSFRLLSSKADTSNTSFRVSPGLVLFDPASSVDKNALGPILSM